MNERKKFLDLSLAHNRFSLVLVITIINLQALGHLVELFKHF